MLFIIQQNADPEQVLIYWGDRGLRVFGKSHINIFHNSVADPDPSGSETFGRIRIRSGTEINISDPKQIRKKEPYIQAKIRWFHIIIHISLLHVVVRYARL
jgi:hypothetical protein